MEAKAIQSVPSSASGGGTRKSDDVEEQAESALVKLGMGIIDTDYNAAAIKRGKPLLTAAQLDELQRQVVIYKYIASGLPVPSSLVPPIWKSVVNSLSDSNGVSGIHRRYPSFVGFSKEFDYRNMMDPEPERCRRTDGKRWRCRKDVVSGQKYCEQHMHRGRRSRKPVESSQIINASNATSLNNSSKNLDNSNAYSFYSTPKTTPADTGLSHEKSGAAIGNVDLKIMGMNMTVGVVSGSKSISTSMIQKGAADCINAAAIAHTVHTDTAITTTTLGTNKSGNGNCKSNSIDDRNGNCSKYVSFKNHIDKGNHSTHTKDANDAISQGFKFSPKSVLQVQACNSSHLCRSEGELEPRRCRRTDGKKWRCRRDVVSDEKYCKMHMHRGAKKRVVDCQSSALLKAAPDTSTSSRQNPMLILHTNGELNINLSISISANPQLQAKDNMNTSDSTISRGSDTTISDTVIAKCDDRDISS